MTFDDLMARWDWRPIRRCPGRFVLAGVRPDLPVADLVDKDAQSYEFDVAAARDRVVVVPFEKGGLISYKRADGTYVHTLNDADGFARKLEQLGIAIPSARSARASS